MLSDYIGAAMRRATYKILDGGEGYFGEIPGFQGVWSNAPSLEACREELQEVLEDWILVGVSRGKVLPVVDGMELTIRPVAV